MSSKYTPLEHHLKSAPASEFSMSFREIEHVLGFDLPPSARRHPAWWSNNEGSHVAVKAWRNAGRKTSRVDVPGEKVVFVRSPPGPALAQAAPAFVRPDTGPSDAEALHTVLEGLSPMARAALERDGGDAGAVLRLLEEGAMERRRRLLDRLAQNPVTQSSSVDFIREDRDAR